MILETRSRSADTPENWRFDYIPPLRLTLRVVTPLTIVPAVFWERGRAIK